MRISPCILAAAAILAGCATPYAERGLTGGYEDREIAPGRWQLSFGGNDFTRFGFAINAALYRAAELARGAGYSHFQIVESSVVVGAFVEGEGYSQGGDQLQRAQNVHLTIQGAHTDAPPAECRNNYNRGCQTFSAEEVMRRLEAIVR